MNNFSNKFLANIILDLVDGLWREDELVSEFGFSEEHASQLWKTIVELRKK